MFMAKPRWPGAIAVVFIFVFISFACAQASSQSLSPGKTSEVVLSGKGWKLASFEMDGGEKRGAYQPEFDDRNFSVVEVPGEVQRQIGLHDMDLYHQSKQLTLVNQKEWWYRKRFTLGKRQSAKLFRLMFDGVDYFAAVWLNGEKLGEHEGSYVPFSYDVTGKLRFGRENVLAVKVTCPWIPKERGFLEYMKGDWTTIDPQNQVHIDRPPFFLGPYWDAIPADGNAAFPMGLWRDVRLVISGFSVIEDLFVHTESINTDGSAALKVSCTIRNYSDHQVDGRLKLKIAPENFAGEPLLIPEQILSLPPGENSISIKTVVPKARLWWTWDMGEVNLYKILASISQEKNGDLDSREVVFGIRTVAINKDMSYWLNGKRLFLKGAWYPMSDYYGSKPTRETFLKDLQLLRAANLNHLVAFTVVEKPDFYELCDRLGILEIVEFPFNQDGPVDVLSYSNSRRETFVRESLSQVRQIIIALRNHPSIIEWAAFAEAHAKGGGWGIGNWDFDQYGYGTYSHAIGKLVADFAPGTVYHPSLCDMGEQHFWMGNAGMGNTDSYSQHFRAQTGFVSEYGSLSLPTLESLKKELSPDDMWSDKNNEPPRWHDLPVNVSAYSYLSSFDYDGFASLLDRVNQYADRHIRSVQELVDDSQLYQAFLMKYATEAYRRKKYDPVNGTRFWDYGEVWPGIRWGIVDYFRVPKMSYYYVKQAQARFALNFAYEEALESQVSGKRLQIPVWIINDHDRLFPVKVECQIQDLSGHVVWNAAFDATIPADSKKKVGIIEWVAPDTPGVYVLRGHATVPDNNDPQASTSTFIKVTPRLFSRLLNMLLIGQRKYAVPIAEIAKGSGISVDVIDETSLVDFGRLNDSEQLRKKYDVIWLAAFDSLWKLLNDDEVEGLKRAVHEGVGFIHTGGRGSFHGGFGEGACLDFTSLTDMLPVEVQNRYDLVLGEADERTTMFSAFSPLKNIRTVNADWSDGGLKAFGLTGFNNTRPKPGTSEVLSIQGHPLLVLGSYGRGRTAVFTGFTPAYTEQRADWDAKVIYPYLLDQELYRDPIIRSYFYVFMELLAAATGESPQIAYETLLSRRETPLFETLKDSPTAPLELAAGQVAVSGGEAEFSVRLNNGNRFARLVHVRAEWDGAPQDIPYLILFDDNYFDLMPNETRTVHAKLLFASTNPSHISGKLIVRATNVEPISVTVSYANEKGTVAALMSQITRPNGGPHVSDAY